MILPNAIIVDVSHWQPPSSIDWKTAHNEGNVVGVIVKLMQGGSPDPSALQHLANAREAGIELLGVYDFGTDNPDHAAFLAKAMSTFSGDFKTRLLVLDSEQNSSSQMDVAGMEEWQEAVHLGSGRWPVLYMGRSGPDGTGRGLPSEKLSRSDLWLPKYGPMPDASKLPPGFRLPTNDQERGGVCRLWQFTGDGINAPSDWPAGIPEKNDLSYALFETMEGLVNWWTGGAVAEPVTPSEPAIPAPPPPPPMDEVPVSGVPLAALPSAKAMQEFLIAQGYSCGPDGADGIWGQNSSDALWSCYDDIRKAG